MAFSIFSKSGDVISSGSTSADSAQLTLVIAIESGLVRGSLVLFSGANTPPRIFHSTSAEIIAREGKTGVKLLSAMLEAVSKVAEDIAQTGLKITSAQSVNIPISKIHMVFSSPWIISKTKTVKISYDHETEITKDTVAAIVNGERADLEKRFLAEHDNALEFDLAFIEQKIFEVKLNGYPTVHFEGKMARELEVSSAVSISSKAILGHIEKAVEKSIRTARHNVECHSSLLLQYSALRSIVIGGHDYIVIHVHNEISDVIVVKRGICAGMASFPQGTAVLSRISSAGLGQLKEVAHSSLKLHSKSVLHSAETRRVTAVVDSGVEPWSQQFMEALLSLGLAEKTPHHIYLLANAHYPHYERALKGIAGQSFEVVPIEKSTVDSAVTHEKREKEDPLMSLYVFALK